MSPALSTNLGASLSDGDGRSCFCRNACSLRWLDIRVLTVWSEDMGALLRAWLCGREDGALVSAWVGCHLNFVVGSNTMVGLLRVFRRSTVGDCLVWLACLGSMGGTSQDR